MTENAPIQNALNQTVEKPASVANGGFILLVALLALGLLASAEGVLRR